MASETHTHQAPQQTVILTIEADRPGGVPTVVDWWYAFLTKWGQQATVLYAASQGDSLTRWQRLVKTFRNWRAQPRPEHPHPTLANAPLPLPLWLYYVMPQWLSGPLLDGYDQIVVAGGPCLPALPLALRRRPYVLWIGTLYKDELEGKRLTGDAWAKRMLNSPFWPILEWQERLVLRRASRILAQSPYTQRRILETVPEVADRLDLAMVPIDAGRFHPLPASERTGRRYLLNVSRINDPRKNIPLLLESFALVLPHHPDVSLMLAGDEPGPALLETVRRLGIQDSVIFKGKVTPGDLAELYQRAEALVIASTQEGLGIVMIEAMACGTPVVATDCGGPEGIVSDGQTGYLVPNNDAPSLARALIHLLGNPDQQATMREGCVAFVESNCVQPVVERKLYSHFAAVFPQSDAAHNQLFDADNAPQLTPSVHTPASSSWREWIAVAWAVFIIVVYMQRQLSIRWPAIHSQLVEPLVNAIR